MRGNYLEAVLRAVRFFGILALAIGWITIFISISLNPWFSITKNALSDLGAIDVRHNFIFNFGLATASIFAIIYSFYLLMYLSGKLTALASSLFLLGSIHLLLIALFPEGTYPHLFVSLEFFVLIGVSILILGIAFLVRPEKRTLGMTFTAMSILGFLTAALAPWPSIGALEVFAISLMTVWAILMIIYRPED
ncbi:MAG: DUF998 domain-containing protein [Aigarchaeota archaeon]|nr:DUF998 domain-containing protein [Aigarchaeota archaeon]